jgi:putative transposase
MVKSLSEKRALIDISHPELSLCAQCILLAISRSSVYYTPATESEENILIMAYLDKQYFETPFYGSRKLCVILQKAGFKACRKRVSRLMKVMNWQTIYRAPNTSVRNKEHKIYPYLLRNLSITDKNQVWSTDITYIAMPRGFMYLCAIIDVHTRFVVGWGLSNTMTTEWCLGILQHAIADNGKPQIVNTDQGSQFTSEDYICYLKNNNIKISMDGKGRALDNIWIERLWRSVKYEDVYLKCYTTVTELEIGIKKYFKFYNQNRPHETMKYKTPIEMYNEIKTAA